MSELSALLQLLTEACATVEREYAKTAKPLPSLDELEPHPLDSQIYPTELRNSIRVIEAAAAQMIALVGRPDHVMANKSVSAFETGCLRAVAEAKIADVLLEKPSGMLASEIAENCSVDEGKITRILRNLVSRHCFKEVAPKIFANNRLSLQLVSGKPMHSAVELLTDENSRSVMCLSDAINDPEWAHSSAPNHSAFNKWTGYPENLFTWYENTPEGRRRAARFGASMQGWSQATDALSIVKHFPWTSLVDGAVINDYGGGTGDVSAAIAEQNPHLRFVLQDVELQLEIAQSKVWPEKCPTAIKEGRIQFKVVDFLVESPVADCDVYYLKNILHDWPDKEALQILKLIRPAMKLESRILLHEYVVQPVCRLPNPLFPQASSPLLPNYGVGGIRPYNQDVNMMSVFNSKERELSEFITLGEDAGLKFQKLWDLMEGVVLEFRL